MKNLIFAIIFSISIIYISSCSDNSTNPVTHVPSVADSIVTLGSPMNASTIPCTTIVTYTWRKTLNWGGYYLQESFDTLFQVGNVTWYTAMDTTYSVHRTAPGSHTFYWRVALLTVPFSPNWSQTFHWTMNCP